jgi:hypothetical protein
VNCHRQFTVSKHTIKIPPLRPGHGISWTFEVSAAAENRARAKTTAKKRRRAKLGVKESGAAPALETTVAPTMAWLAEPVPVERELAQPSTTWPTVETIAASTPESDTSQNLEDTVSFAQPPVPIAIPRVAQRPPVPPGRSTHLRTIALAAVAVLVVGLLAFPRHSSAPGTDDDDTSLLAELGEQAADLVAPNQQPAALPARPIAAPAVASVTIAPRDVSAPAKKARAARPDKARVAESTTSRTMLASMPAADVTVNEETATKMPGSDAIAPAVPAASLTSIGGSAPVTITGCLEMSVEQDAFRLTDTEGTNAPKSRSWRTGFLKKRSTPVALVEPPDWRALQTHVGRRVAATGLLTSHDLKVSALRFVGASCN